MIIKNKISKEELENLFDNSFGTVVKIVVDVKRNILSAGHEFHIDCAEELIDDGSLQKNLWGANLYRHNLNIDFISLINIKPMEGNRSMEIEDPVIKRKVEEIIKKLLCG
jgi:hypothetical protein